MTFFLLGATAFVSTNPALTKSNDPAVHKLMEVSYLWELLQVGYEPTRERDATWLDVGFRSKYGMAKKYASIEMIESAFGCPVFVRGPHQGDMDFNSKTAFGYYNPVFISKLTTSIKTALAQPLFKKVIKSVYDNHLKSMANTYHRAYDYLHQDAAYLQNLQSRYLSMIASPAGTANGALQEEFRSFAEQLEKAEQSDVYEGFTAPAFWLRRSIDGTDQALFDLLSMVIQAMEQ